ncbi:16S rRNA (guanine(966)-N(2))-methyltransferase RsmD [Wielerella bovis]|uniref:16S rRNA (guanine(966)-N(2))-methyltransferase RsmD n=1 Tax=Wielerella bovis TaxID=2917790 RepID=UPI002019F7AD|nr:16S rRNA (guanine(966)-N(2))-methyltransferase RsmD [Wielerella bovis]ULJ69419.1 16S rRNA (guanine(966)-N(2))-methyltransferase RsmD [Wielerella bovis]
MKPSQKINPKHNNQVRIIGGTHRGRKLNFIHADGLRPTPDSVRERLFNWLGQDLTGQNVLDLFAGSGALGFEAASRHAKQVVMCETNREMTRQLQHLSRELGFSGRLHIHPQDGLAYLKQSAQKFDTVFLDPPFAWQNWTDLWTILQPCLQENASVYIEAGRLPDTPDWLYKHREGGAGQSYFALFYYE